MATLSRALATVTRNLPFPGYGGSGGLYGEWGRRLVWNGGYPGGRDWTKVVGDGSANSIVEACVLWMCRNFPQAPVVVKEEDKDGIQTIVRGHAIQKLFRRPNPFYSGKLLWYGTLPSFIVNGNGYILKGRNDSGRVTSLWFMPHFMVEARWVDPTHFIDWYDVIVNGVRYPVPVEDMYHLRYGIDPNNIRYGRSPLRTLMEELGVDKEASAFTASILKNLGVPGVVIAPDKEFKGEWGEEKREAIKAKFKQDTGGDNRGDPVVFSKPTNVTQFGFSPQALELSSIREIPVGRVTAVLGIPAAVVGFNQKDSRVAATRAEERDQAWENCIIPTQGLAADELTIQMLPEFTTSQTELERQEVAFDLSRLPILLDAQEKLANIQSTRARAGIAKRSEVRAQAGLPVGPDDDVYIPAPGVQLIDEKGNILSLPSGKNNQNQQPSGEAAIQAAAKEAERRDQILLNGLKEIVSAVVESKGSAPSTQGSSGFKVLRDEHGRINGVEREN